MAIYLVVDGARLEPETADQDQLVFRLNLPAHEIRLISGYASPAELQGSKDNRRLGVALRELRWRRGEQEIVSSVYSPGFIDGFHHLEHYNDREGPFRWTSGDAGLPPALFPPWEGETRLVVRLFRWEGSTRRTPPKPEAALLSAFENIGENCELALAQRHYGVEPPLSLLRWASITPEKLLHGLRTRFDGLGEPDTTEIGWEDIDYRLRTPWFNFHTSVNKEQDEAGVAEILATGRVTLRLLRRKLLKDISDARRIFVFRTSDPTFGKPEMHRLHDALRAIGPASLLCVILRQPGRQPGDRVEPLAPGLYAGYLEKFVIPYGPYDEWLALCASTLALHHGVS